MGNATRATFAINFLLMSLESFKKMAPANRSLGEVLT